MRNALLCLFLLATLAGLPAIELGSEARAGSINYPWNQLSALPGTAPWATDISRWFWGGSGWADIPLGEDFDLHLGYETDPVLRNVAFGLFRFDRGIARIGVGPFAGFLNGDGNLASFGLSTSIRVQWPGLAFVSARSDGGLALGLVPGLATVPQTATELSAGFYTPNAIVTALVSGKRFSQLDSGGDLVVDDLTRYALVVDIYKKNIPYRLTTTLGYDQRSKYYQASGLTDGLGSAIAGLKLTVDPTSWLRIYGEYTNAIFTFGMGNLTGRSPSTKDFLWSATLGLVVDLEGLDFEPGEEAPAAAPAPASDEPLPPPPTTGP